LAVNRPPALMNRFVLPAAGQLSTWPSTRTTGAGGVTGGGDGGAGAGDVGVPPPGGEGIGVAAMQFPEPLPPITLFAPVPEMMIPEIIGLSAFATRPIVMTMFPAALGDAVVLVT